MTIANESYKLGLSLKNINKGENIYNNFQHIQDIFSQLSYQLLNEVRPSYKSYYSFPIALDIIKANKDNGKVSVHYKESINEIIESDDFQIFCDECVDLAEVVEKTVGKLLKSNSIVKQMNGIETTTKMRRILQQLYIKIQQIGLKEIIIRNHEVFSNTFGKYEKARKEFNGVPFNRNVRGLISDLKNEFCDKTLLYTMETVISLLKIIQEVIFETHLNLILILNKEEVKKYKVKKYKNFYPFILETDTVDFSKYNNCSSIVKLNWGQENLGVIKKRSLIFENNSFKMKLRGYIYPPDGFKLDF